MVQTFCELAELYSFKLIHFSTDYVFDGSKNKPYQESDSQSPINFYGDTKAKGEKLILNEAYYLRLKAFEIDSAVISSCVGPMPPVVKT